jgi:uncharacterized damage-inducible protein DinB
MPGDRLAQLVEAVDQVNRLLLEALDAVPPELFDRPPAPDEWSVAQVIGHALESQDFWVGQLERLVGEDRPAIGRRTDAERQRRTYGFTDGRPRTLAEAQERLQRTARETRARLSRLPAEVLDRTALHPDRGEITGAQLIEYLLIEHLSGHVEQVHSTLRQLQKDADLV